ncbi:hypothetical protein AB6A40_006265 [Gnathostoma spinigerum]|uniref:F-box domain-containing protein n=1 Tax=Gnathostoma spinigerum TaxID=75299 RepID=A0ABD6EQ57_9BILA
MLLLDLPNELILRVLLYCSDDDITHLRLLCRRFEQLIVSCPITQITSHKQRSVSCISISFERNIENFVFETFMRSDSNHRNRIRVPRAKLFQSATLPLTFCFRKFRIFGIHLSNLPLCSKTVNCLCDLLLRCPLVKPKTLRICDCYVGNLHFRSLQRLLNLCGEHLVVLSFTNLTGVSPSLINDDLLCTIAHPRLRILVIRSLEFHSSTPNAQQTVHISDKTLMGLPCVARKVKLELCQGITPGGICDFIERFFDAAPDIRDRHFELDLKQCQRVTIASFECEARRRRIQIDAHNSGTNSHKVESVARRQYRIRRNNEAQMLSIEIDISNGFRSDLIPSKNPSLVQPSLSPKRTILLRPTQEHTSSTTNHFSPLRNTSWSTCCNSRILLNLLRIRNYAPSECDPDSAHWKDIYPHRELILNPRGHPKSHSPFRKRPTPMSPRTKI